MPEKSDLTQSKSVQDFLKAVYSLQSRMERVSTNALADVLSVQAPSVTDMAQRLVAAGLLDYERYKGVVLTPEGEALALKIIRRHRLIELYLVTDLGYALQDVHSEAENLEHAVSDRFIEAIAAKLGNPEIDPHGDPIPHADGTVLRRDLHPLTEWPLETPAEVSRIKTDSREMLEHILDRGFNLGVEVQVLARDPFEGPVTTLVDGEQRVVGHNVASCILVESPDNE
ncbi:MAG: metal-dependent transcriptional regulator [Chloroflexi bacterium]|nr:metal-dependent transcriptional regulator [Chloroflexota bacterium]